MSSAVMAALTARAGTPVGQVSTPPWSTPGRHSAETRPTGLAGLGAGVPAA
ncbi:MAG: hypothetical protein JF587_00725 [Catenulisporales bacterium]|nr:hypothetical protein [Catenulisporales bacterium]